MIGIIGAMASEVDGLKSIMADLDVKNISTVDFYKGKIIPTDLALQELNIEIPETIEVDGQIYVKAINGYIREDLKNNKDVKRGLYMLSIPSTFVFKCNITEFAHVYKERGQHGTANPEVKECAEMIVDQLENWCKWFNRDLFMNIQN